MNVEVLALIMQRNAYTLHESNTSWKFHFTRERVIGARKNTAEIRHRESCESRTKGNVRVSHDVRYNTNTTGFVAALLNTHEEFTRTTCERFCVCQSIVNGFDISTARRLFSANVDRRSSRGSNDNDETCRTLAIRTE